MIDKNSLVSIIVPCYMQANFIADTLESVLLQSYQQWECIIIDDGSTDNTQEITKEWLLKDHRFKYFKKVNEGVSSARNIGIMKAKGDYLQFLDADDTIHTEKIKIQIDSLRNTSEDYVSICDYYYSFESDIKSVNTSENNVCFFKTSKYLHELISNWEDGLSIPIHCFLFKSFLFKKHNLSFNENLINHVDWDCWINLFKFQPKVKFIDEKLALYRIHDSNMTKDRKNMNKGFLKAIKLNFQNFEKNSEEYYLLKKKFNHVQYGINSQYTLICISGFPFFVLYKFFRRVFLFLRRKLKSLT